MVNQIYANQIIIINYILPFSAIKKYNFRPKDSIQKLLIVLINTILSGPFPVNAAFLPMKSISFFLKKILSQELINLFVWLMVKFSWRANQSTMEALLNGNH